MGKRNGAGEMRVRSTQSYALQCCKVRADCKRYLQSMGAIQILAWYV